MYEGSMLKAKALVLDSSHLWTEFRQGSSIQDCVSCLHFNQTATGCIKSKTQTIKDTQMTHTDTIENTHMQEQESQDTLDTNPTPFIPSNDSNRHHTSLPLEDNAALSIQSLNDTDMIEIESHSLNEEQSERELSMGSASMNSPLASSTPSKPTRIMKDSMTSPAFKTDRLFSHSLQMPRKRSLDSDETELNNYFNSVQFSSSTSNIIKCKTGGQPIFLAKIAKPRIDSSQAKQTTKRNRTNLMSSIRKMLAGESEESVITQQTSELKRNPLPTRRNICDQAGIKSNPKMSSKTLLAMKEATDLTWSQLRQQRRYLKEAGLAMPNEHEQRKIMSSLAADNVVTEITDFDHLGETHHAVFGRVANLSSFVTNILNKHKEHGTLTWHNSTIPEDEIWVKFGGDHGKHSLKFTLQIANTHKPNSKHNTFLVGMAKIKDNYGNLKKCITSLHSEIDELSHLQWEGKRVVLFLFGDYDFLTKLYGLSGAQGTYPCLWCLTPKTYMAKKDTPDAIPRLLSTMKRDHRRFKKYGHGIKKNVSRFHNSLHRPLLDIETSRVAPPYLHILLGIVLKHHRLLEEAVHQLDIELIKQPEEEMRGVSQSFHDFGKNWPRAEEIKERIQFFQACIIMADSQQEEINNFQEKISSLEDDLADLQFESVTPRSGPVCSQLDTILDKHKITPQSYHSRSFIGNHCHKYVTSHVYKELTAVVVRKTQECTYKQSIIDTAYMIREKFNQLNELYKNVHIQLSHGSPISQDTIPHIQSNIKRYMTFYRKAFNNKIIPKQHILEKHCISWIQAYGFGLALHGEQGGELIHATVAKLERRGAGIRNEETRVKLIITSQHLQTSSELIACTPPIKRRRTKQ